MKTCIKLILKEEGGGGTGAVLLYHNTKVTKISRFFLNSLSKIQLANV